jgi:SAM-dependent methyltransferase
MARGEGQRRALTVVGGTRGELIRYASLVPEGASSVLVLGAGDGRLAEELVRRGASVTAVDPSPRMVERAEHARGSLPGEAQARLVLFRADLRSLRLPQRFSAVFAPRNAVALVASRSDLESLFVTAREHLAAGAPFAFDLSLSPPRWLDPDDVDPHEGLQPERAVFTPHLRGRRGGEGDQGIHRLLLRHFTAREVDHALAVAGLEPLTRDKDFEGRPWQPGADRMVVVAQVAAPPVA